MWPFGHPVVAPLLPPRRYPRPAVPTAITISKLVKQYAPGSAPAVDGVDLAIGPGDLFFLLGPSGCGKTTLLRMIAGFIEPTAGSIAFTLADGRQRDVTFLPPNQRNTGMVFQSYALWPHMTVAQNVAFGLEIRKVSKDELDRRVLEALRTVQMDHLAQRKPNALSGGQQQRVALARALVIRPDVLLLDEPLSNLDAKLRNELRSEIRRICKDSGITTVYVTHDQKEALSMADQVAIMSAGRLVQLGPPADLYRRPASKFVAEFLGETNFLPGQVIDSGHGRTKIRTAAGELLSAHPVPASAAGGSVLVSLRPEALIPVPDGAASLRGRVIESQYLGEIAQQIVELKPIAGAAPTSPAQSPRLKLSLLNPAPDMATAGHDIALAVRPEDVVLIPA
ncbi:MAG: ABC transporter ATP-binding protein [Phycisphaerales bacterium]|nr:ABC transporter ATP-binding protein [Phycisphaerales bacterium]